MTHWCPEGLRSETLMQRSTQHKLERSNQSTHSECWLTLNLFKRFPHSGLHSSLTGAAVKLVSMCLGITIPSSVITALLSSRIKFSFYSDPLCFRLIWPFYILSIWLVFFFSPYICLFQGGVMFSPARACMRKHKKKMLNFGVCRVFLSFFFTFTCLVFGFLPSPCSDVLLV